jgi:hypothetical protein
VDPTAILQSGKEDRRANDADQMNPKFDFVWVALL